MKTSRHIRQWISLFLIVVFLQQTIGGLYFHNAFHAQKRSSPVHESHQPVFSVNQGTCTCIDDFYVPYTAATVLVIPPFPDTESVLVMQGTSSIPFAGYCSQYLRGPPSASA